MLQNAQAARQGRRRSCLRACPEVYQHVVSLDAPRTGRDLARLLLGGADRQSLQGTKLIFVVGVSGTGKTTLLTEITEQQLVVGKGHTSGKFRSILPSSPQMLAQLTTYLSYPNLPCAWISDHE